VGRIVSASGRRTVTTVEFAGSDAIRIEPPCAETIRCALLQTGGGLSGRERARFKVDAAGQQKQRQQTQNGGGGDHPIGLTERR